MGVMRSPCKQRKLDDLVKEKTWRFSPGFHDALLRI